MSTSLSYIIWIICYSCLVLTISIALYGIVTRPHLIKKVIAYTIFSDAINLFIVFLGYRRIPNARVAVLPLRPTPEDIVMYEKTAVDPLVQCLVLTAVVIGLAVILFFTFLAIQLYRLYGTLDSREIAKKSRLRW